MRKEIFIFVSSFVLMTIFGIIFQQLMNSFVDESNVAYGQIEFAMWLLPGPLDLFGAVKNALWSFLVVLLLKMKSV